MEEIRHAFPQFVPNQVLSSGQLNALRDYLDQQDRLSRVRLTGTGIVCGLSVERTGNAGPVTISEGFGISSDGYLISLPAGRYSHWRDYQDPGNDKDGLPAYPPWRQRPGLDKQIELLELLEGQENPVTDKPLTAARLNGRVVVLYLQVSEQALRTCLVTDCNNKGANLQLLPRLLLVKEADLTSLPGCDPSPLPVVLPRLHTALALTEVTTTTKLNDAYARLIEETLPDLLSAIEQGFDRYGDALGMGVGAIESLKSFERLLKRAHQQGEINQYHYDLVADVANAQNEFIGAACRWLPDCASPTDHPRHLMLDHLDGTAGYRHAFRAAPSRSHWHGEQARTGRLLRRLLAMLGSVAPDAADELRITPSHGEHASLGERAVPHYFKFDQSQSDDWRPDDCCTLGPPWAYHGDGAALGRDYRRCSLLRIEGHLGSGWAEQQLAIAKLRRRHNAEFNLLVLYLDGPGKREREAFEDLRKVRLEREEAENDLSEFVGKAVETANFRAGSFKSGYADKASKIRTLEEGIKAREREWLRVRDERKPLCNLGHLEADYGALRAETLCVFHRLLTALEGMSRSYVPPMEGLAKAEREIAIKEAARDYEVLSERITAERDASVRRELQDERFALESRKLTLEAEGSLITTARRAAPVAIAKVAGYQAGELDKAAANAAEAMKLIRADNAENTVQLAERVSLEGLHSLLHSLMQLLPKRLAAFDLPAFAAALKQLISDLIALRLMTLVKLMIAITRSGLSQGRAMERAALLALSNSLKIEEQNLQHMLLSVLHDCRHNRLIYAYYGYHYHRQNDNSRFADFASRHPGMEHLAGVEKGGTFILVAEDEDPDAAIVADFSLHGDVPCCCDPPDGLCLPPVALPDYRIARLRLTKDGDAYQPVELFIDLLANDYDPNTTEAVGKDYLRQIELLQETSEVGAKLTVDRLTGVVHYRLERIVAGAVDRFDYRLKVQSPGCSGEDKAQVLVLLVPEVEPKPELGGIGGLVTWYERGVADAVIKVDGSDRTATTDQKGGYRIDNLQPGDYRLQAQLWGGEVTSDPLTVGVLAGETARADFGLPKEQEAALGNLHLNVFDFNKQAPIRNANAILLGDDKKVVAQTGFIEQDGLYKLDAVPAGSYTLVATADGYNRHTTKGVVIQTGATELRDVALLPVVDAFVPDGAVEFVAIREGIRDDVAKRRIADTYVERQANYMTAVAAAGKEASVRNSEAYAKAEEFLTKTLQDPDLEEAAVVAAYEEVSRDLAISINRAGDARKEDYRSLLTNVSKAFMDRVSLESPEELKPTTRDALEKMNTTMTGAGIDVEAVSDEWKGEELGTGLGLRSTDRITRVIVAR